jgi:hypothetical protein
MARGDEAATGAKIITRAELEAWCADAAPRECKLYARAAELPQPIGSAARMLAERGLVTLARHRDNLHQPFEFLAIRLDRPMQSASKPQLKAGAVAQQRRRQREADERACEEIMTALIVAARTGDFCPTNMRLAEIARLPSGEHASKIVCALRDEGRIEVELEKGTGTRVVTIRASGLTTRRGRTAA